MDAKNDGVIHFEPYINDIFGTTNFLLELSDDEDSFEVATDQTRHKRAIIAGWIDGVRLIDNMKMGEGR